MIYDSLIPKICIKNRNYKHVQEYCHELNSIKKEKEHYFVYSNDFIIHRTNESEIKPSVDYIRTLSYDIENYDNFYVFYGDKNSPKNKVIRIGHLHLSKEYVNLHNGFCNIKSKKGNRPIRFCHMEYFNVIGNNIVNEKYLKGSGARISYGCGLIIPKKIYKEFDQNSTF